MVPTFGTAVAVDGPYQNQLRDGVGNVAQDVEDVEAHGCSRRPAQAEVAGSRRGGLHVSASADGQPFSEAGWGLGLGWSRVWGYFSAGSDGRRSL